MRSLLSLLIVAFASAACTPRVTTYEDCLLHAIPEAKTPEAVGLIKVACKGKFPKKFDFDEISKAAAVAPFGVVARDPDVKQFPVEGQTYLRDEYFRDVIAPRINPDFVEDARVQFEAYARSAHRLAREPTEPASASASSARVP